MLVMIYMAGRRSGQGCAGGIDGDSGQYVG